MQILIDGDACNTIHSTEIVANNKNIPCHIYCDTQHLIESDYSQIHIVGTGIDSADFAIINRCGTNDIVITNDSGLAAMALAKGAFAINTSGFEYTNENIMMYLNNRHLRKHTVQKTGRMQVKGILPCNIERNDYMSTLQCVICKAERNIEFNAQKLLY